jgi:hypothetical protein
MDDHLAKILELRHQTTDAHATDAVGETTTPSSVSFVRALWCSIVAVLAVAGAICIVSFVWDFSDVFEDVPSLFLIAIPAACCLFISAYFNSRSQAAACNGYLWPCLTIYSFFHFTFNVPVGGAFPVSREFFAILLLPYAIVSALIAPMLGAGLGCFVWEFAKRRESVASEFPGNRSQSEIGL